MALAKKYAADMREKAFVILCGALKSSEPKIRKNAAWALATWGIGSHERIDVMKNIYKWVNFDKRALAPLNEFLKSNPKMIPAVTNDSRFAEYLANFGNGETAEICFEQLKKGLGIPSVYRGEK